MPKLTKTIVEKTAAHPTRDIFIWDSTLPGFGLRIYPSGKRKYIVQYRSKDKRQRRAVIGQHGVVTAEQARTAARDMLAKVAQGEDPAAYAKAARAAPTVKDLANDYLEQHAIPNKRPASVRDDRAMIQRWVLPKFGQIKVAAIGRKDIEKLHNSLQTTPYAANRLLALLSKMFSLAVAWNWRADNPVKGIPRFQEGRRDSWLSSEELARLWATLDDHPNKRAANAVKLMLLTGSRKSEVLNATWDQFDLERGVWTKPSHHTKQKRTEHVPLSGPAIQLLAGLSDNAAPGCPHLFPGKVKGRPLTDIKNFWKGVCKAAGIQGTRLHDLRHTFASHLVSEGTSLHIVGKLLGHTQPQTTNRYAHLDDVALREATEGFGASIGPTDD